MSIKKLFDDKNRKNSGKLLKANSLNTLAREVEDPQQIVEAEKKRLEFVPPVDYSRPENFAKFGSAEEYYRNAFSHVVNFYPYDGSSREKLKFENNLNPFEKYIFDVKYPKSTGFVNLGISYGTTGSAIGGYSTATGGSFIIVKGGPHPSPNLDRSGNPKIRDGKANVFKTSDLKSNNLSFGGPSGSSVEFWFKKKSFTGSVSQREVVLDVWNGEPSASEAYGRFTIELSRSADRFYVTHQSGTKGVFRQGVPLTGGLSLADNQFTHYAFAFLSSSTGTQIDFYKNGEPEGKQILTGQGIGLVTGTLIAHIGALRTNPSGTSTSITSGMGKLSASLDEFRYWKQFRKSDDIGRNWFSNVNGGSNQEGRKSKLGVYFKFNEGVTNNNQIDKVVLDYSGRINNGTISGYSVGTRSTSSAIMEASASVVEFGDPIIRTSNPILTGSRNSLLSGGIAHDQSNTSNLFFTMPTWIIEQDENTGGQLKQLTQIISSYFDTLYAQISTLSKVKNIGYTSGSNKPFPYGERLLESLGFEAPELFANASVLAQVLQKDDKRVFESKLYDVKNEIYKNLYNNVVYLYKSKGTHKSFRNLIRSLGVDEKLVKVKTYANDQTYELKSQYLSSVSDKKYVDVSGLRRYDDMEGIVYQNYNTGSLGSVGILSGSNIKDTAITLQGEFILPRRPEPGEALYKALTNATASMFGFHTPDDSSPVSTGRKWADANNDFGLQVYSVHSTTDYSEVVSPVQASRDAYFIIKNRAGDVLLSSSVVRNAFDNRKWNIALRLAPAKRPFAEGAGGTELSGATATKFSSSYTLDLYGVNMLLGEKQAHFSASATLNYATGSSILMSNKVVYAGASRTNFTGSVLTKAESKFASVRFWNSFLDNETINAHAIDADSYGTKHPFRNEYNFESTPSVYIPSIETLALHWDFANVTGSDGEGRFRVLDFSSGSVGNEYQETYLAALSQSLQKHNARGDFFKVKDKPVRKEFVYSGKLGLPEELHPQDFVQVLTTDDVQFQRDDVPTRYFFNVEKSMYDAISNEMLSFFASIDDFNNLIGEPVNKYRADYKDLSKLREIFFRRIENTPNVEAYVDYYKWLDSAIGSMLTQLFPASAGVPEEVKNIIESHVLERNKYQYAYTHLKRTEPEPIATIQGIEERSYNWRLAHAPPRTGSRKDGPEELAGDGLGSRDQDRNTQWWAKRAERGTGILSASIIDKNVERTPNNSDHLSGTLNTRSRIFTTIKRTEDHKGYAKTSLQLSRFIRQGSNQFQPKDRTAPTEQILIDRFETIESEDDLIQRDEYGHPVGLKRKVPFRAKKNGSLVKGELFTPFTVQSSSVETGYQHSLSTAGIRKVDFSGYHEDSDGMDGFEDGMQGPFTRQHVGGRQYRNQLNHLMFPPTRSDSVVSEHTVDITNRREGFTLDLKGNGTASINRVITGSTPKGHFLRGVGNRTVLNIANIKTTASAVIVGNFQNTYEVVQTSDRSINNLDYRKNTANYTSNASSSPYVAGIVDFLIPNRTVTKGVFVERFSSPGGIETQTPAYLDRETQQFSANNALTFRNISVRNILNSQLRTHQAFGGFIPGIWGGLSVSGTRVQGKGYRNLPGGVSTAELSLPDHLEYLTTGSQAGSIDELLASAHKVQRNGLLRFEYGAPNAASSPEIEELPRGALDSPVANRVVYVTGASYDNAFVSHPIPRADRIAWFMNMSGADAAHMAGGSGYAAGESLYDTWVRNSSLYPTGGIAIPSPSLISGSDARNVNVNTDTGVFEMAHIAPLDVYQLLGGQTVMSRRGEGLLGDGTDGEVTSQGPKIPENDWRATFSGGVGGERLLNVPGGSPSPFTGRIHAPSSSVQISRQNPNRVIWKWAADIPAFVPWTQLRQGDLHPLSRKRRGARHMNTTQIFRFENQAGDPQAPVVEVREEFRESPVSMNHKPDEMDIVVANFAEANNDPLDTALNTNINQALQRNVFSEQTIRFSEGNIRQGFSNVLLDKKLNRGKNTQTPYTYMTRLRKEAPFQQYLNGIYAVTRYKHEETIFPRDKFSALSGTRERANYRYPSWANDEISSDKIITTVYTDSTTLPSPLFPMSSSEQHIVNMKASREIFTKQSPRYKMWKGHPNPTTGSTSAANLNTARNCFGRTRNFQMSPRAIPAGGSAATKIESMFTSMSPLTHGFSGSVWPLDSFMMATPCIDGEVGPSDFSPFGKLHLTATAIAHTFPAGELMMVPWDPLFFTGSDGDDDSDGKFQGVREGHHLTHHTASRDRTVGNRSDSLSIASADFDTYIMPKYVYSVATSANLSILNATRTGNYHLSGANQGVANGGNGPLSMIVYSPGGPTTRPPWTAYHRRFNVSERQNPGEGFGLLKFIPKLLPSQRGPFYNSYADYKKDVELAGKDYAILAEYKNSDHVVDRIRNKQDDKFIFTEGMFNLTGAAVSSSNQDGFISRHMLSDLFQQGEKLLLDDLDALSRPTDYSIESKTIQKLLPYQGFYPVNRTLQIATLFSQSYTPVLEGSDANVGTMARPRAFQTLIDPLFAPGILYNSIRFGVAVDHPVRTLNQAKGFSITGSHKRPLGGVLSASLGLFVATGSAALRYQIASGSKIFPARPEDLVNLESGPTTGFGSDDVEDRILAANRFYYGRRLPFESLLDPKTHIGSGAPIVDYHIDATFYQDVTASVSTAEGVVPDSTPYESAISNFLGSVPEFFLENEGVTMLVGKPEDPENITVVSGALYIGEVVLRQTENFNIYSNPSACGPATATGSLGWDAIDNFDLTVNSKTLMHTPSLLGFDPSTGAQLKNPWPLHRGEFAPHTAPYYYGPSIARFTYIAPGIDAQGNALRKDEARTVTLKEIIQGCKVEFLNEDSWKYDADHSGTLVIPAHGWNRAWANRMNLDATLVLDNKHAGIEPQGAWAIGTRWESPILDFPNTSYHDDNGTIIVSTAAGAYSFSSSVKPGEFNRADTGHDGVVHSQAPHTYGMWHQYGILPYEGEGVYMELRNIGLDETMKVRAIEAGTVIEDDRTLATGSFTLSNERLEYRFSGEGEENNRTAISKMAGIVAGNHNIESLLNGATNRLDAFQDARKIPLPEKTRVKHLDGSLWKLTGFNEQEIGKPIQLGKLAKRKTISEAIVAIPFINTDAEEFEFITIPPPRQGENEGPQVAKLREKLALYNLPPALERNLSVLIPNEFPFFPDGFDFSQPRVETEKRPFAIYLFEFEMELNQQDIADIWNNVMPRAAVKTLGEETSGTVFSVDHAIPCTDFTAESIGRIDRRLRDLIDVQSPQIVGAAPGLDERIRWMVFKVKRRSVQSYEEMIQNSLIRVGAIDESEAPVLRGPKAYGKRERNFNWPYDFFSMIEMAKVTTGVQFRPDVSEIDVTGDFKVKQPEIGGGGRQED